MRMLQDGKPVWMGCDTGKQMHRDKGLWDAELFDYASVYNADFSMNKEERLEYHQTAMTHAMLFTGVDVVDGQPRRWRVENSWDDKVGQKGFFLMNDSLVRGVYVRDSRPQVLPAPRPATGPRPRAGGAAAVGPHGLPSRRGCGRRRGRRPGSGPHGSRGQTPRPFRGYGGGGRILRGTDKRGPSAKSPAQPCSPRFTLPTAAATSNTPATRR